MNIRRWAYPNPVTFSAYAVYAGVAEMADRVFFTNWSANLAAPRWTRPTP